MPASDQPPDAGNEQIGTGGAWIFLSHSHKDFNKVAELRNELEQMGHRPLMFFLKCMDDNSELDDLVRREIEAREWFLLCESDNSRNSRWVQREIDVIKSCEGKIYTSVDLNSDLQSQIEQARTLVKRASVFISYDVYVGLDPALEISRVLREHDFAVYDGNFREDHDIPLGAQLREAAERGFVLVLISHETSGIIMTIQRALRHQHFQGGVSNIIAIILEDPLKRPLRMSHYLDGIQQVDFRDGSLRENAERLVADLKTREMQ